MGKFDSITLTPDDFASEVSTHTTLTGPQLKKLFPTKAERRAFLDLMKIVTSSTNDAKKKAQLMAGIAKFAGVVLKLAKKAALA